MRPGVQEGDAGVVPGSGDERAGPEGGLGLSAEGYEAYDVGYDFGREEEGRRISRVRTR